MGCDGKAKVDGQYSITSSIKNLILWIPVVSIISSIESQHLPLIDDEFGFKKIANLSRVDRPLSQECSPHCPSPQGRASISGRHACFSQRIDDSS